MGVVISVAGDKGLGLERTWGMRAMLPCSSVEPPPDSRGGGFWDRGLDNCSALVQSIFPGIIFPGIKSGRSSEV